MRALGVDMATVVGHKFGAPKGVAALYIRYGAMYVTCGGCSTSGGERHCTSGVGEMYILYGALYIARLHLLGGTDEGRPAFTLAQASPMSLPALVADPTNLPFDEPQGRYAQGPLTISVADPTKYRTGRCGPHASASCISLKGPLALFDHPCSHAGVVCRWATCFWAAGRRAGGEQAPRACCCWPASGAPRS